MKELRFPLSQRAEVLPVGQPDRLANFLLLFHHHPSGDFCNESLLPGKA